MAFLQMNIASLSISLVAAWYYTTQAFLLIIRLHICSGSAFRPTWTKPFYAAFHHFMPLISTWPRFPNAFVGWVGLQNKRPWWRTYILIPLGGGVYSNSDLEMNYSSSGIESFWSPFISIWQGTLCIHNRERFKYYISHMWGVSFSAACCQL